VRPCNGGAIFITEILGIPTPITVDYTDCFPGQWSYIQALDIIIYQGFWENAFGNGHWNFAVRNSWEHGLEAAFGIHQEVLTVDTYATIVQGPGQGPDTWFGSAYCQNFDMGRVDVVIFPWIFGASWAVQAQTYQQIRAFGADPQDTAPVTWDYHPG
jgi:hypothetical protein